MDDHTMDVDTQDVKANSSPVAQKALQKLQRRAPGQCGSMSLSHFLYLCSYLKILFDLGYKSPHGALDAFITQYPSWAALQIPDSQPYHMWFSENGPSQVPSDQVLSDYILAEICRENSSYEQNLNNDFSKAIADFVESNPTLLEKVEPPRPAPALPTKITLEFLYTPRLEQVARHAAPTENEVVRLSTALDAVSNRLRVTLKRSEIVVGQISESDRIRSLRYLNKEAKVVQKTEYTSLVDGGRCCTGLVVVNDAGA